MDLQIDDFHHDAAAGLARLYQAFPRKVALYIEDLIGREEPDEFGLPSTRHQSCLSALLWLADEGYIRYDALIRFEALDQAVLTEKAFVRLSLVLSPLDSSLTDLPASIRRSRASLANQLREASSERDGERLALLLGELLGQH